MNDTTVIEEPKSYDRCLASIIAAEAAITSICMARVKANPGITYADFFGMGVARRALALSKGFRSMVEQKNSLCALPLVRMQLDTALRLYAGFFAPDPMQFSKSVMDGEQINRMKSDDGSKMTDKYLVERVAEVNTWIMPVYDITSGYIHLSSKHIFAAFNTSEDGHFSMMIGPEDPDRHPEDFLEPMDCINHINLIIGEALRDWFDRSAKSIQMPIEAEGRTDRIG